MKFTCDKSTLNEAMNTVLRAIPTRTTMDILECVVIEAYEDKLKFTTNDLSMGIETTINANVIEKGVSLLKAKMFSDIIRKMPDSEVSFESNDDNSIVLKCLNSKFNISGYDYEEFPMLPSIEKENKITISQFTLKEMIRQTIFSISNNENNKILTGELFEIIGDEFKIASLDMHRISIRKMNLNENYDNISAIIPGKTLNEMVKLLEGNAAQYVDIYFSKNYVIFEMEDTVIISRLIDGNFYNINKMITNDYELKVSVNKKQLLECVERSVLLIRDNENKPVIISITDGNMLLEMNTHIGNMNENIEIEKEGSDIRIAFDPKFLIDVLRVIDEENVNMYFINSKAPCYIKDDDSYIYLILPVNI